MSRSFAFRPRAQLSSDRPEIGAEGVEACWDVSGRFDHVTAAQHMG